MSLNLSQFINSKGDLLLDLKTPLESQVHLDVEKNGEEYGKVDDKNEGDQPYRYGVTTIDDEEFEELKKVSEAAVSGWQLTFVSNEDRMKKNFLVRIFRSQNSPQPGKGRWFNCVEPM